MFSPTWPQLYALSRADRVWPYAYPPLHAFLVAPFVVSAGSIPDWLMVRVPPLFFDIATGILLYAILAKKTQQRNLARLGFVVWLLNPVTWYDTAVQGHFEAEWLFFVVLAYWIAETRRGWLLPTLSLAIALCFKQNAILFALPFWASLFFFSDEKNLAKRIATVAGSVIVSFIPLALISLPFLLASNDYWYMNVQYVADVPLQTQSWLVALAGIFSPDNIFLNASSFLTLLAAAIIAILAARRGFSLWLTAMLIVLAFFLLSKKVVGYYYVMIFPFALVSLVPAHRFRRLSLVICATAFISLSPYFASWTNQDHWWLYALLGIANSVLWLAMFVWLWRNQPLMKTEQNARVPAFLSIALYFTACAAALAQPFINNPGSPIRAPLIPNGLEPQAAFACIAFVVLVGAALLAANRLSQHLAHTPRLALGAYALVVLLAPLYFLTFALTKESTAALEFALKTIGL